MYTYQCTTVRVIDGNTVDASIDLGFNVVIKQRIKLYGVRVKDIRDIDAENKQLAMSSKNKLAELLGSEFVCETIMNKRGKAGRVMGKIFKIDPNGQRVSVNDQLIELGYAERFGE